VTIWLDMKKDDLETILKLLEPHSTPCPLAQPPVGEKTYIGQDGVRYKSDDFR